MKTDDRFLMTVTARLAALIEAQERLFEVIRKEQTQLGRMDRSVSAQPSAMPMHT
jgi:hypothetical protein